MCPLPSLARSSPTLTARACNPWCRSPTSPWTRAPWTLSPTSDALAPSEFACTSAAAAPRPPRPCQRPWAPVALMPSELAISSAVADAELTAWSYSPWARPCKPVALIPNEAARSSPTLAADPPSPCPCCLPRASVALMPMEAAALACPCSPWPSQEFQAPARACSPWALAPTSDALIPSEAAISSPMMAPFACSLCALPRSSVALIPIEAASASAVADAEPPAWPCSPWALSRSSVVLMPIEAASASAAALACPCNP
mmetsp:Transcript_23851/g.60357  ORF Transcript_23851/g.60357 Transcript_23851/m.60357 type:complete len:258 (-) Transcript_23851:84-857(-)